MNSGIAPPIGPEGNTAPHPDDATWPGWIGGVSIAFGALTVLGVCCGSFGAFASPMIASKAAGIDMPPAPGVMIAYLAIDALIGFVLAALLIMGGIGTLRRRASGVRMLRRYAVLRLSLVLPILIGGLLMLKPQSEWSAGIVRSMNEWKESQKPPLPVSDDEREQETPQAPGIMQFGGIAIGTLFGVAWPLVVFMVLRRPDAQRAVEAWDA